MKYSPIRVKITYPNNLGVSILWPHNIASHRALKFPKSEWNSIFYPVIPHLRTYRHTCDAAPAKFPSPVRKWLNGLGPHLRASGRTCVCAPADKGPLLRSSPPAHSLHLRNIKHICGLADAEIPSHLHSLFRTCEYLPVVSPPHVRNH